MPKTLTFPWPATGAAACVAAACPDARDNASVCGFAACGSVADRCGVARSCGSCAALQACVAGACQGLSVAVNQSDVTVGVGEYVSLTPTTLPARDAVFTYGGWMTGSVRQALHADVGSHFVAINASDPVSGALLGQSSVRVLVLCSPAEQGYGACCVNGTTQYLHGGERCAFGDDPNGGTCGPDGVCVRACLPNVAQHCNANTLEHQDSCGAWGDVIDDCGVGNRTCVEQQGSARCVAQPPACSGQYRYECRAGDGVRIDAGCGRVEAVTRCAASQDCVVGAQGVDCVAKGPCDAEPGTIPCAGLCVDAQTSRTDCGACGRQCSSSQQCVHGACTSIPGCNVVCEDNRGCNPGEVCVYAGDCTQSQCQAINVLTQNATAAAGLAQALTQHGLVRLGLGISGPVLTYTLTNLGPAPVADVVVTSTIGKVIAQDAGALTVAGVDYIVLTADPVLRFSIPELQTTTTFTVTADHVLDLSYVNLVANDLSYNTSQDVLGAWNRTKDALTIGINSEYDGNTTTFHLTLTPSKTLGGVSVPLEIPKCLAQKAAELKLNGNYHIIADDPLIVWQFDELNAPKDMSDN